MQYVNISESPSGETVCWHIYSLEKKPWSLSCTVYFNKRIWIRYWRRNFFSALKCTKNQFQTWSQYLYSLNLHRIYSRKDSIFCSFYHRSNPRYSNCPADQKQIGSRFLHRWRSGKWAYRRQRRNFRHKNNLRRGCVYGRAAPGRRSHFGRGQPGPQ